MLNTRQIVVRPRVLLPGSRDALLLEDEVRERIEARQPGFVELYGPPGSGKTVALAYLARCYSGDEFLVLADCPQVFPTQELLRTGRDRLVVCASPPFKILASQGERWRLAGWSQDECVEYLLAAHHDQCAAVFQRIQADATRAWLGELPELWQLVIDRLAADKSLGDVKSALRSGLHTLLPAIADRMAAGEYCCEKQAPGGPAVALPALAGRGEKATARLHSLLRHAQVQTLLAAEYLTWKLRTDPTAAILCRHLPASLVRETALMVASDATLVEPLRQVAAGPHTTRHAMAASILHAAGCAWKPRSQHAPHLHRAQLAGVCWPEIRLKNLAIDQADLSGADLRESRLTNVHACKARLCAINLHGARIRGLIATHADLSGADLSFVRARAARLDFVDLREANLEGALLRKSSFNGSSLQGARFCRADLSFCSFTSALLAGADFSGAHLRRANLSDLVLRGAEFAGATFDRADLFGCDLEHMQLPGVGFEAANLDGSYLSASHMPGANFRYAGLTKTGLAHIQWERADLRDADLRGASFHLGSSRNGLVGSPLACEGSRTGFYTDEYVEQGFRDPEEIRKANLRGADLRGAKIDRVDFYLVDLRDALYTPEQADYFRQCKAILETRV